MERYIAILRGINVGGHNKILMADLRALFESINFTNVVSYIQSGNVVFSSPNIMSNISMAASIEEAINAKYGFDVPVIVMSHSELKVIVDNNPYPISEEINKHLVTFIKYDISEAGKQKLAICNFAPDKFKVGDSAIYLYCYAQYHKSKMGNNFFEKQLDNVATTRNWKTTVKLLELSSE